MVGLKQEPKVVSMVSRRLPVVSLSLVIFLVLGCPERASIPNDDGPLDSVQLDRAAADVTLPDMRPAGRDQVATPDGVVLPSATVLCGWGICTAPEGCCGNGQPGCKLIADCPFPDRFFTCDGPEDCAVGTVCCSVPVSSRKELTICHSSCSSPAEVVCHLSKDCPPQTPTCCPAVLGMGLGVNAGACRTTCP